MMRRVAALFAAVAVMGFYVTARSSAELSVASAVLELQENPIPISEDSVKAGSVVYARFCRSCHGRQAKGDGMAAPPGAMPANLVDDQWDYGGSDAEIFSTIKEGIAPDYIMQPWDGRISDDDIWNTVNYLRDLATHANQ